MSLLTAQIVADTPALYETEGVEDPRVTAHFFNASSDWFMIEYDVESHVAFGYVILNGDFEMSELGYFYPDELTSLRGFGITVERDRYFVPDTLGNILQQYKKQHGLMC